MATARATPPTAQREHSHGLRRAVSFSTVNDQPAPDPTASNRRTCPWCAAAATDHAQQCASCGAALAQRESIGDLRIPGLTSVDPALEDYDKRPLHLTGPSPSQGMAPALIVGAMAGGPIGLAAIGGVAAIAAVEYIGASRGAGGGGRPEDVGKPSEIVLQALSRLEDGSVAGGGPVEAVVNAESAARADSEAPDAPAAGEGDAWRDLPPNGSGTSVHTDGKHEEQPDGT